VVAVEELEAEVAGVSALALGCLLSPEQHTQLRLVLEVLLV